MDRSRKMAVSNKEVRDMKDLCCVTCGKLDVNVYNLSETGARICSKCPTPSKADQKVKDPYARKQTIKLLHTFGDIQMAQEYIDKHIALDVKTTGTPTMSDHHDHDDDRDDVSKSDHQGYGDNRDDGSMTDHQDHDDDPDDVSKSDRQDYGDGRKDDSMSDHRDHVDGRDDDPKAMSYDDYRDDSSGVTPAENKMFLECQQVEEDFAAQQTMLQQALKQKQAKEFLYNTLAAKKQQLIGKRASILAQIEELEEWLASHGLAAMVTNEDE